MARDYRSFGSPANGISKWMNEDGYWQYQIPILGTYKRAMDDARYWSEYQKNTGVTVRYPGRHYGGSGMQAIQQSLSFGNRVFKNMYR